MFISRFYWNLWNYDLGLDSISHPFLSKSAYVFRNRFAHVLFMDLNGYVELWVLENHRFMVIKRWFCKTSQPIHFKKSTSFLFHFVIILGASWYRNSILVWIGFLDVVLSDICSFFDRTWSQNGSVSLYRFRIFRYFCLPVPSQNAPATPPRCQLDFLLI